MTATLERHLGHGLNNEVKVGRSRSGITITEEIQGGRFEASDRIHHTGDGNAEGVIHFPDADQTNTFDRVFVACEDAVGDKA
jgi:hypothetical protein